MRLIGYFRRIRLVPRNKNGRVIIDEYFDDPGIVKKAEFSDDGTKIIITRICPNGHPKPKEIDTGEYSFTGSSPCPTPE